jgi:hypothetical protein
MPKPVLTVVTALRFVPSSASTREIDGLFADPSTLEDPLLTKKGGLQAALFYCRLTAG